MKYLRLLNAVLAVTFISGFIVWIVGAYREYNGKKAGWPPHVFLLCWGIIAMAMSAKGILLGRLGSGGRGLLTRERRPKQFWVWIGILSVAGTVALIIGVVKLITDISIAS
jgi:hypothetical protein